MKKIFIIKDEEDDKLREISLGYHGKDVDVNVNGETVVKFMSGKNKSMKIFKESIKAQGLKLEEK